MKSYLAHIFMAAALALLFFSSGATHAKPLETVDFGNPDSEAAHDLRIEGESEAVTNDQFESESARRLLPPADGYIDEPNNKLWGHSLYVTMKVDPEKKNYFTARFWGDEGGADLGRLILLAEDEQDGKWKLLSHTRHGDFEPLNFASTRTGTAGPFPGRFYYSTAMLPRWLTQDQEQVTLEIRHFGRYQTNATGLNDMYQPVAAASKAIYNAYTHTDPFFSPPADEVQGEKPPMPIRPFEREAFEEQAADRTQDLIDQVEFEIARMQEGDPFDVALVTEVYGIDWLPFHQDDRITQHVDKIVAEIDRRLAEGDLTQVRGNPAGALAEAFLAVSDEVQSQGLLDEPVEFADEQARRRAFYAEAFVKAQEAQTSARRVFTNQAMWSDEDIYPLNQALQTLAPERAMDEQHARRIVLEVVGLKPWTGSWSDRRMPDEPVEMAPLFTDQAQGREPGLVGGYGERQGAVGRMARFFDDDPEMQDKILKQAHRVLKGRTFLRYPHWDEQGHRIMRGHSVLSNRHTFYPGRADNPSHAAAHSYTDWVTVSRMQGDELAINLMHRAVMEGRIGYRDDYGVGAGLENVRGWRYYQQWLQKQEDEPEVMELPIEGGDFVWSDEQNGILVFKHGDVRAYISFMFTEAEHGKELGVNNLARIHYTSPRIDRLATVRTSAKVDHTGEDFVRREADQWMAGQDMGPWRAIPGLESYWAGEALPKSKGRIPTLAMFYEGRYGDYYIAMNTTETQSFEPELDVMPAHVDQAVDLASGQTWDLPSGETRQVQPGQTVVLYLGAD